MATKIFATLFKQNDKLLYQAKKRLRKESERGINKIKNQIPTQNQLINKFSSKGAHCSARGISKSERDYRRYKGLINKIDKKAKGAQSSIKNVESKINKVISSLDKIRNIADKLSTIISALDKVISIANVLIKGIGFIPSTQYFPNPSGPIVLAKDLATKAEGKIVSLKAAVKGATSAIGRYYDKAKDILNKIILKALSVLKLILNSIKFIKQILETMFLKKLTECATTNSAEGKGLQGPGGSGGIGGSGGLGGSGGDGSGLGGIPGKYGNTAGSTGNVIPLTSPNDPRKQITPEEYLAIIGYPGYSLDEIDIETTDPMDYDDDLTYMYENILQNMKLAGQTEFIEKIYNAKFEMIGYSRSKKGTDFDITPVGILI